MKQWQCTICKYIHKGETPPEKCPVCGADASKFIEINKAPTLEKSIKKESPAIKPGPDALEKKRSIKAGPCH